ncbi:MAG: sigma-70 family RNA polymerase sigma factor [Myxococcota bacterium]
MESSTDRALWAASCAGDTDAFVALVGRHHRAVSAITLAATGDLALSEDLAQETFLSAWRHIARVREPEKIAAWLCTIARNLGRRAMRQTGTTSTEPLAADLTSDAATPEDLIAAHQEHAAVWAALAELPLEYREPLILAYRDGWSSRSIAEVLGLTVAAVDQRLSRGRKRLRLDVAERLQPALLATKPSDRVHRRVAAMVPLLPTLGSPLTPPLGLGLLTMKKLIAFSALLAFIAGLVAWGLHQTNHPTVTTATATATATTTTSASNPASRTPGSAVRASPIADRREAWRAAAREGDSPHNTTTAKGSLELTTLGNVATVNLEGGPSRTIVYQGASSQLQLREPDPDASVEVAESFQNTWDEVADAMADAEPAETREVQGTVVSSDGEPVAGAVVLAGSVGFHYARVESYASGSTGATTDAGGAFRLEVAADQRASILAMKGDRRSRVVALDPSSASAKVSLYLDATARLVGETRRDGEGTPAHVEISHTVTGIRYALESDLEGRFALEGIDTGRYVVQARAESGTEAPRTREVEVEVEVTDSQPATVQLDLPTGGLIATELVLPDELGDASALIRLLSGRHAPTDLTSLSELLDTASQAGTPLEVAQKMFTNLRLGLDGVVEFDDLEPGDYTVCVHVSTAGKPTPREDGVLVFQTQTLAFTCETTSLAPGDEIVEIAVDLRS